MGATAVVSLTVDESGAVAGLTRFEQAANRSMGTAGKGVSGLAQRLAEARAQSEALGASGTATGQKMAGGYQQANKHALTHLDTVRLLRDDLGIRIPRAMEKLISQWSVFQTLATAGFGVLAFAGSLELVLSLVSRIGSRISDWAQDILGNGKAMQEFRKYMIDAENQQLISPKNRDQSIKNLHDIQAEITKMEKMGINDPAANAYGFMTGVGDSAWGGFKAETKAHYTELLKMRDEVSKAGADLGTQHNEAVDRQADENSLIGLEGYRKAAQEFKNQKDDIDRQVNARTLSKHDGDDLKLEAAKKYHKELSVLQRESTDEYTILWNQAVAAHYQGEEKAEIELQQQIAKRRRDNHLKGIDSKVTDKEVGNMQDAFNAGKVLRMKDAYAEEDIARKEAAAASLESSARIVAQESIDIDKLKQARIKAGQEGPEWEELWDKKIEDVHTRTYAQLSKNVEDYFRRQQQMREGNEAAGTHGYLQIQLETQHKLNEAAEEYKRITTGITDPAKLTSLSTDYEKTKASINNEGDRKSTDLHQRNADETAAIWDRAASARSASHGDGLTTLFAQEQQQTAKITAEYDKQYRAWQKMCDEDIAAQRHAGIEEVSLSRDTVDRKLAIDAEYNAQILEQQRNLQDKLAGEIESMFDNPMAALKKMMKHQMAEILADWVMQATGMKAAIGSSSTASTSTGGILSGIFGRITGGNGNTVAAGRTASYLPGGITSTVPGASSSTDTMAGTGMSNSVTYSSAGAPQPLSGTNIGKTVSGVGGDALSLAQQLGLGTSSSSTSGSSTTSSGTMQSGGGVNPNASATAQGMAYAGAGLAAYGGAEGVVSGYTAGGVNGFASSTMSGAAMGTAIGSVVPGLGTVVGGAIGAGVGAITNLVGQIGDESRKTAARDYYNKTLFPEIEDARKGVGTSFGGDYLTAISEVNKDAGQGMIYMRQKFGEEAADWVNNNYLAKELAAATSQIERGAKGGASYMGHTGAEFHSGGVIGGFGDLATSSTEGFIHALRGETVMDTQSSATHAPALAAMRSGASPADIASMYMQGMRGPTNTAPAVQAGDQHNWDVKALDARSFGAFLRSGGAKEVSRSLNNLNGQYAGDGQV